MKLLFKNARGKKREIAQPNNMDEMFDAINAFVDECNAKRTDGEIFASHYIRINKIDDNTLWLDVGSWTESLYWTKEPDEEWPEEIKNAFTWTKTE